MDPNFWFSPGGQALLSVLSSLRIGPRKEVARAGIRPLAPLETYMRFRGAEQLLSQLPAEYQPFARTAVYSGIPVDLARIFETGRRERQIGEYAGQLSRSFGISPELAELVVVGAVPLSEAVKEQRLAELPEKYTQFQVSLEKLLTGQQLSGEDVQIIERYRQFISTVQESITTKWILEEGRKILATMDPTDITARTLERALAMRDTKTIHNILVNQYPVLAARAEALKDINAAVKELVETGNTNKLSESLIRYTVKGVLTDNDVRTISDSIKLVHSPVLARNVASVFRKEFLPYIRNPEIKRLAEAIISSYELGYYNVDRFLSTISQLGRQDASLEERRVRQEETKTSPVVKAIDQEFKKIERDLKDIFSKYDKFKFVQPDVIQSAKEALKQFEEILNRYKQYISSEMFDWYKHHIGNFRERLDSIEAEIERGKKKTSSKVSKSDEKRIEKAPEGSSIDLNPYFRDLFPAPR